VKFTAKFEDSTLAEVFEMLEEKSNIGFLVPGDLLKDQTKISLSFNEAAVEEVLHRILDSRGYEFEFVGKNVVITQKPGQTVIAQPRAVKGQITNSAGEPIPGVTVAIKGTTLGTISDAGGYFTLTNVTPETTLIFSFVGMITKEMEIGASTVLNVTMMESVTNVDEVVVTALGIQKQSRSLAYSAQQISSTSLSQARNLNILSGLSGKIAGISITQTSTGVGADTKVLLRGNRSIALSSQPIYVIDGITLNGDISNISPDDIESISVLKGANAAALYGSRAQNGAIVVTTKSGKGAGEGITTNVNFTYQGSSAILPGGYQNIYGQGANGIYAPSATVSWGPKMDGSSVAHWSNDPNYEMYGKTYSFLPQPDNIKDFFRIGNNFVTNVQVNSKRETSNTAVSFTYTNASGIVETNNLKSYNLSMRHTSNLTKNLFFDSKINLIRDNFENVLASGEGIDNPMRFLYILPRNIRTQDVGHYQFRNNAGQIRQHFWKPYDTASGNPYWTVHKVLNPAIRTRTIGMVSLKYQVTENLSIQGRSAFDGNYRDSEGKYHNDTYTLARYGEYIKNSSNAYEWNSDVLINYHKSISDITFDLNAGANNRKTEYNRTGISGTNFNIENLFVLTNCTATSPYHSQYYDEYNTKEVQSVYGFGEISYKNAIFLNITGRNDWSSTLPSESRSYFYPSVGLSAVVGDLIKLPEIITHLKLRGSYAEVGNDAQAYSLSRSASIQYGTVYLSSTMPNENLKPERTKSIEAGFDLRLFDNRISAGVTYYKTNTSDQLFGTPVPAPSGVTSVYQNGADIQNQGFEVTIGAAVISKREVGWDIDVNWSKNTSKILEIAEGFDVLSIASDFIREYKLVKGHPYGDVYSKGWLRDANGNVIIQTNGLPSITSGKTVLCANYNPDWLAGISNSFRYKNFTLSALIDIRQGGTFISCTEASAAGIGVFDYTLPGREGNLLFGKTVFQGEKGVTSTGEDNTVTTTAEDFWLNIGGTNNPTGEAFVRNASNIRMREMILGYELPKRLISKTFLRSARISLVGRNLFFISNKSKYVDSETMNSTANSDEGREAFALPTTRTFGVSLNLGF